MAEGANNVLSFPGGSNISPEIWTFTIDSSVHDGGGGSGPMEPSVPLKDYTDAKIGEVRSDIKADIFAFRVDVDARFATIEKRLDKLPTTWVFVSTLVGVAMAAVLGILAILAYTADRSDSSAERAASIAGQLSRIEASLDQQSGQSTTQSSQASDAKGAE